MRALLVAASPLPGTEELVSAIAPDFDLVIAVDGGGAVCRRAGIVPDYLVGDFDSLDASAVEALRSEGARIVAFPAHKDVTDLELALAEAADAGATEVAVVSATGGRLDHTIAAIGALSAVDQLSPWMADPENTMWVLSPAGRGALHVDGAGTALSIIAVTERAVVSVSGVEWPLEEATLEPGSGRGVSNVVTSQAGADVEVHSGKFLVFVPRGPRPDAEQPPRGTAAE